MARPKGVKVTNLTPDNVAALREARQSGYLPTGLEITATTATWPLNYNAAGALQTIQNAIGMATGTTRRALHAPRRKLEKQVLPGAKVIVPTPDPPKASRDIPAAQCPHATVSQVAKPVKGVERVKCARCGLIFDRPVKQPQPIQKPARPGQGGVTTAQVVPAASQPPAAQNGAQPPHGVRYGTVRHGDSYLVVELGASVAACGRVLASCDREADAQLILASIIAALTIPKREVIG